MKNIFLFIFALFPFALLSQVQVYNVNASCSTAEYNSPSTIEEFNCDLGTYDFLGQVMPIRTVVRPIEIDVSGSILDPTRILMLESLNSSFKFIYQQFEFATMKEFSAGEAIGQSPYAYVLYDHGRIIYEVFENDPWPAAPSEAHSIEPGYVGIRFVHNSNTHFGYLKWSWGSAPLFEIIIEQVALELSPWTPIIAGSTTSIYPTGLVQSYNPYGILLNWNPYLNSVACQVRGGPAGGTDPHNFIVQGNMPTQLFINGNGLTVGQNYQWKVRCASGLNPPSGVTPWSAYDYFIYDP